MIGQLFVCFATKANPQKLLIVQLPRNAHYCKAKNSGVKFVVVHDLSRFSRDWTDQAVVIAQLEASGSGYGL